MERQLRSRMEESLKAESQLREEAEASIRLYKDLLDKMRAEQRNASTSTSEHNNRIKEYTATLTNLINEKGLTPESTEHVLQILAALSREANHS